eukprot:1157640-Pelagomonas_calceolata.AAC.16
MYCCCEAGKLGAPWLVGLGREQELVCDLDCVRLLGGSLEGEGAEYVVEGTHGSSEPIFFAWFWAPGGPGGMVWVFLGGERLAGLVDVLCGGASCPSLPTFMNGNVTLPPKDQFRYLGLLVDKQMNLKVFEEHAVQPHMAAQQMMKKFVHHHALRNRPHALLWLSKVYGIPAGMYACQVWGTEYFPDRIPVAGVEKRCPPSVGAIGRLFP